MLPLATNVAREEGLHERSSYLISPDDLPPSEGEGALPENGMRHIDNKKTPVECEQSPINWHFFIICIAYFIIPIDIVGYKSYNPIMFVGIIGFII